MANSELGAEKKVSSLPNRLTVVRLACIPIVVVLLQFSGRLGSFLAGLCFGLAFVTDVLDGFFARRYGAVTSLGKFLDPLADKILVTVTMIALIPLARIPVWMVLLIVAREIAVTGLRAVAVEEGLVIQAGTLGKYKTIFQSVALMALCIHYEYFGVDFHLVGIIILWIALFFTIWSGWDYFRQFSRLVFSSNNPKT